LQARKTFAGILQIPSKGAMALAARVLYEFERFRLDPGEQLLLADGEPVSLTPKAFQILFVLIQSNGRLLI
jgi:DNA-binding response OmpR family regulator